MAETGGPVYEGMGKPEKQTVADKVRKGVEGRFREFKNKGVYVEQKWMNAYQRVVDALDPGKRKAAAEKMRPVAVAIAKTHRIGSAVVDVALRWVGLKNIFAGLVRMVAPNTIINIAGQRAAEMYQLGHTPSENLVNIATMTAEEMRRGGAIQGAVGLAENIGGRMSVGRRASAWMADISGYGGEKIAQISNKILGKKPMAA